ncbi:fatty acid desaturase [Hoeflea sp. WL0058]|uniref:Fatty acid desaturase n=1 Tax=Flavimaribacter sediminis TaxID=2865987 RepID=A0AAE3CZF9_9HYPH|nr:fatty acid desaturase [Flavimaribacter sediminis]MBW8635872.1 fatty acid desaturase [Flavimaribacter sediminis]
MKADTSSTDAEDARRWSRVLYRYKQPHTGRGFVEIAITLVPFILFWAAAALALHYGYWTGLLLAVPAAAFLVRMFMIQHDCGHGSFVSSRSGNDWIGRFIGVLTLTPYDFWKRTHNLHHANSGSLERRGFGDVSTLTVSEYKALGRFGRLKYRLYRNPVVMFGLGPVYVFLLQHRLPVGFMKQGWKPWLSTMSTNAGIVLAAGAVIWFTGVGAFLAIHLSATLLAGAAGIWLFYVQHQFEHTLWDREKDWNWHEAALQGSSHYRLPSILRWLTANIGMHHVHHLSSRIPYYRLPDVLGDHPELKDINTLSLMDSVRCVRLVLWDEENRRLVSFKDAGAMA